MDCDLPSNMDENDELDDGYISTSTAAESVNPDQEYFVKAVLAERKENNKTVYLIEWEGYPIEAYVLYMRSILLNNPITFQFASIVSTYCSRPMVLHAECNETLISESSNGLADSD
jgi:hypothetical protein